MKNRINLIIILLLLLSIFSSPSTSYAYSLLSRESQRLDESLSDQSRTEYAFPEKVVLVQVSSPVDTLSDDTSQWVDQIYYYSITRLKLADVPYNYLIDRSGQVFEGRKGWEGVVPELLVPEGVVLVGYLSNSNDITSAASASISELVQQLSTKYGISREEVITGKLDLVAPQGESSFSKLKYAATNDKLTAGVAPALAKVNFATTDSLDFKASVSEVKYEPEVNSGERLKVTLKLKNESTFPWFTLNDFIYLKTADGEDSPFAVNGEWDSFDTPTHIEGKSILPDESVDVTFELQAALLPGEFTEKFYFTRLEDKVLSGSEFELKFTIARGDLKLVEILETETGALNVRSQPGLSGQVVGQVDVGVVYVLVDVQNGWYKIKYEGDEEGWVSGRYVKEL